MYWQEFIGPSYESQSQAASGERCVNWFVSHLPVGGKTRSVLYPVPGVSSLADTESIDGSAQGRGIFAENGRCFIVYGQALIEVDAAFTLTKRGEVARDDTPVNIVSSGYGGSELFITSFDRGFTYDLSADSLTTIGNNMSFAGQLDGFFLALDLTSSTLQISELFDGLTWDPTQVAQRTSASDPWKAMIVVRREIILIGEKTGEVFFNAGLSPFPFARRTDVFFEVGIEAAHSLARFGKTIAWLGSPETGTARVYWLNGYTPEVISTEALEWIIEGYRGDGGISDAIGWSYNSEGHEFYVLEFPRQSKTHVFNATTRLWHEQGFWSTETGEFLAYRPRFHTKAFNRAVVTDGGGSKLYDLSSSSFVDVDGNGIRRLRRSPHLFSENRNLFNSVIELEADTGVTSVVSGQGSDPKIALRLSNDGGRNWGPTRMRSLGAIGEYGKRIRWTRCGSGRDRVAEVWVSDPVPSRIIGAYLHGAEGRS